MPSSNEVQFELVVAPPQIGQRLDQALAQLYPDYSRMRWQQWIRTGAVLVNQNITVAKYRLRGGETITARGTLNPLSLIDLPQAIVLSIVHEDADLLIINKPIGMVVHPATGNPDNTLLNALLHHAPELAKLPRAGIVHRLDKDTSGLLMIGRHLKSYTYLSKKLQAREISREYLALVQGKVTAGGTINAPLGRHPRQRTKIAVLVHAGRPAITHYRIAERFSNHTLLDVQLETGRTHQIRVHLAYYKHPVVGDPAYGGRLRLPPGASATLSSCLRQFKHQALHAHKLSLIHPRTHAQCVWTTPLPADFTELLQILRAEPIADTA